jgi:AhpD family alkylhydroperoxidase
MDNHDVLAELRAPTRALRHAIPGPWGAFLGFHEAAMEDGVVPKAVKEAVALAISVVKRCDGCIAYHAKAAARAGATPDVVAELLAVALLMDGGTASVYAPRAWQAFNEFHQADVEAAGPEAP